MNKLGFLFIALFLVGKLHGQSENQRHGLSLAEAIEAAIKNNPQVLAAQKEIDAAQGRILQAGRIPNPEFAISWSETPTNFNIADADSREIGIAQQIEFPTKRSNRINVAEADRGIVELEVDRVRALVTAATRQAYYKAALTQQSVRNLEEVIALLRSFQEMATIRYQAQKVPFLEVLRSKVEIAKVNNQLIEERQQLQSDIANLNRVLGRAGSTPVTLTDELTYTPFGKSQPDVVDSLRPTRAALKIALAIAERQQAAASLANTSYLPDFSVGLSHQRNREQPPFNANSFTGTTANSLGINVGISVPLWFWQGPKGEAQEADAKLQIAEINRAAVERNVVTEIENAYRVVQATNAQVKAFQESLLRDIQDQLESGITSYRNNQIDALNLVDIYRTYTQTKAEYYRALYNFNVALANLQAAGEETIYP